MPNTKLIDKIFNTDLPFLVRNEAFRMVMKNPTTEDLAFLSSLKKTQEEWKGQFAPPKSVDATEEQYAEWRRIAREHPKFRGEYNELYFGI